MSSDPGNVVRDVIAQTRMLALAFAFGVVLFAGVATFLVQGDTGPLEFIALDSTMAWVTAAVAAMIGLGGGPVGSVVLDGAGKSDTVEELRQRSLAGMIMGSALRETTGLIGGLLILNGGQLLLGWGLAVLSVALLVTAAPDPDQLENAVRRLRSSDPTTRGGSPGSGGDTRRR